MTKDKIKKGVFNCPYTQVSNLIIQDVNLSNDAKALYCYLASLPNDWEIYKAEIFKHFKAGRDKMNRAFKELEDIGIINKTEKRDKGKFGGYEYTVNLEPIDTKELKPRTEKPRTVKPLTDNQTLQINTITNKTLTNSIWTFEKFWDTYDKKRGKPKAMELWARLSDDDRRDAMAYIFKYILFNPDKSKRKDPERYIKYRAWEDELIDNRPKSKYEPINELPKAKKPV